MKKLFPLLALAVLATGFTSCKKEHTCSCTYTEDYGNGPETSTDETTITGRRPEASISCQAFELGYTDAKCSLK